MSTDTTSNIDARLSRMEAILERLDEGMAQAPVLMSIATDTIDETLSQEGIDVADRVWRGMHLLKRLSDPQVYETLNGLVDFIEQAPGLVSIATDAVDEAVAQANSGPVGLQERISGGMSVLAKVSQPEMIIKFQALLDFVDKAEGLIAIGVDVADEVVAKNTETFELFAKTAEATNEAIKSKPQKVGGIFALLRAIGDPDRQKALGLVLNILKNLGRKL